MIPQRSDDGQWPIMMHTTLDPGTLGEVRQKCVSSQIYHTTTACLTHLLSGKCGNGQQHCCRFGCKAGVGSRGISLTQLCRTRRVSRQTLCHCGGIKIMSSICAMRICYHAELKWRHTHVDKRSAQLLSIGVPWKKYLTRPERDSG